MLVSCLTATHGRFSALRVAVACFLNQDYAFKEHIILNNHPVPLVADLPRTTILNEPGYPTLGDCRNRLLEVAQGEFIRTWDDDDLYLPWAVRQGVQMIGDAPAFKPARSWFCNGGTQFELADNVFEAAMTTRRDVALKYGYKPSGGDEHTPLLQGIEQEGGCRKVGCGWLASYIYTWGMGRWHASGTLGSGLSEAGRNRAWQDMNQDTGDGAPLTPDYDGVKDWWKRLAVAAPAVLGDDDAARLKGALDV